MVRKSKPLWLRLLMFSGGLAMLFVVGAVTALQFLDAESMRRTIIHSLSETAELPIDIGKMKFDWTEGLGLKAQGFTIHSHDNKRVIFSAESLFLTARLLPLFYGEFRVKNAVVNKPVARIYLDLPVFAPPKESSEQFPEMDRPLDSDLKSDGLLIEASRKIKKEVSLFAALFDDSEASADESELPVKKKDSLLESLRAILKEYHFTIKNIRVRDGVVHVIKRQNNKERSDEPIKVDFKIRLLRPGPGRVNAVLKNMKLRLGKLQVRGAMQANHILSSKATLNIDLKSKSFDASQLKHILFFLPGDLTRQIKKYPFSGKFDPLTFKATVPLNSLEDLKSFRRRIKGEVRLKANHIEVQAGSVRFPIDHWTSSVTCSRGKFKHLIRVESLGGRMDLNGTVAFKTDSKGQDVPVIQSKFKIERVNLSQLRIPKSWKYTKGNLSGTVRLNGPLLPIEHLRIDGNLKGTKVAIAPRGKPYTFRKVNLRVVTAPKRSPQVKLDIDRPVLEGRRFRSYSGRLAFPKDKILFLKSVLLARHGKVGWKGYYLPRTDKYKFKLAGRGLRIEDTEKKHIQGKLKFTGLIHGQVLKNQPIARGLSGDLKVQMKDGSIKQWGAGKAILSVLNPTSVLELGKTGMAFDYLGGRFKLDEGLVESRNLAFESRKLKIYVQGHWDMPTGDLNLNGKALPSPDIDKALKAIPIVGTILAGGKKHQGFFETYFDIRGSLTDPDVNIKAGKSLLEKPKRMLNNLGDLLTPDDDPKPKKKTAKKKWKKRSKKKSKRVAKKNS